MLSQEEWQEWLSHPGTKEFVSLLKKEENGCLLALSGCESWDEYLRKDGYLTSLRDVIKEIQQIAVLGGSND